MVTQFVDPIRTPFWIHISEVEFPGREVTELAVNIIIESMNAQHDVDVNEYFLLELFIDHRENGSAFSVEIRE